ncbi:hypothetical protein Chor_016822 [Crotalus horridus]
MQLLRGFLVALALHMVGAQKKDVVLQNSTTDRVVVSFFDVWNRSSCQPLEKLVSVVSEYPHEVEHVFKPSCVSLRRCCGCCRDEALQCVPVEMANITMEVVEDQHVDSPAIIMHACCLISWTPCDEIWQRQQLF